MSAKLSKCRQYRYQLSRNADMFGHLVFAYFGINPSTADEQEDDSTVKKWMGFTQLNNGKQFIVGNVFAYRATNIGELATASDPIGPDNDKHISSIIQEADILVPCWGSRKKVPDKLHKHLDQLMERLKDSGKPIKVFGWTKSRDSLHPLMLAYKTPLVDVTPIKE